MERVENILVIGSIVLVLVLTFFAYLFNIIPQFVVKVDSQDFEVLKIEYTNIGTINNETIGALKLSIKTNGDNLIISASSGTIGCADEFKEAGLHTLETCKGDPSHTFYITQINQEHNFNVCATALWSRFYKTEPTCKSIILLPYQTPS